MTIGGVSPYNNYNGYYGMHGNKNEKVDDTESNSGEKCQTCAKRKYQDGSDENVSFKAAAHISPEAAAGAVRAHEGEHVSNAYTSAAQKNGKVISAAVSIHTSICPECGRTYVSGGTTSTKIKYPGNPYEESKRILGGEAAKGKNIDYAA
ncbi:MAG: hypothetical protein K1V96_03605 [Lachnospiraceae bacterium]